MRCPGQDTQYWKPGAIYEAKCPKCGRAVEFFKDDTTRRCQHCDHRFVNPRLDFGCAAYCKFAEQCLGNLPPELMAQKENLLKDRVAIELKRYLRTDFAHIGRATRRARYAEQIGRQEEKVRLAVVLTAAYLLELAAEGAPALRQVLEKAGAHGELADEVEALLDGRGGDDPQMRILQDADLLAQLEQDLKHAAPDDPAAFEAVNGRLQTEAGRMIAAKLQARR